MEHTKWDIERERERKATEIETGRQKQSYREIQNVRRCDYRDRDRQTDRQTETEVDGDRSRRRQRLIETVMETEIGT